MALDGELIRRVGATVARGRLLAPGEPVLALVSGGADSTLLALVLHALGHPLETLHVAHGLRGAESDADAEACRALAAHLGRAPPRGRRVRLTRRGSRGTCAAAAPCGRRRRARRPGRRDRAHARRPRRDDPLPPRGLAGLRRVRRPARSRRRRARTAAARAEPGRGAERVAASGHRLARRLLER